VAALALAVFLAQRSLRGGDPVRRLREALTAETLHPVEARGFEPEHALEELARFHATFARHELPAGKYPAAPRCAGVAGDLLAALRASMHVGRALAWEAWRDDVTRAAAALSRELAALRAQLEPHPDGAAAMEQLERFAASATAAAVLIGARAAREDGEREIVRDCARQVGAADPF
jgi:hypothetical protein